MQCDPAYTTIKRFGGSRVVSKRLGKSESTVIRWWLPKARGGTNGNIPREYWEGMHELATEIGETLSITDLVECPDYLAQGARQ